MSKSVNNKNTMENVDYTVIAEERRNHIYANVGHALYRFRKEAGYSLEEAAELIGYKPEKLRRVEEGGRISVTNFLRVVATYGGHVFIEGEADSYSIEELYQIPPITPEEIESKKKTRELERKENAKIRTREWLNKMSENWNDENE